ncbi:MAG: hypothetical protein ACXV8O_00920 [Methylobacter sp.]
MGCGTRCETGKVEDKKWQDLSHWPRITLNDLRRILQEEAEVEVRVYTVATTRLDKKSNEIYHIGSGPNLEGELATLCICKHSMRQNHKTDGWKGLWILGLTSRAKSNGFNGEHYLFYMMKVDQAFESHKELYEYLDKEDKNALQIKNALKNPLGDIFEPKSICTNSLDPTMYKPPHKNHSHGDDHWLDDIVYKTKPVPLLVGELNNTFVWSQPMIKFTLPRGVGNMKLTLGEKLFCLLKPCE